MTKDLAVSIWQQYDDRTQLDLGLPIGNACSATSAATDQAVHVGFASACLYMHATARARKQPMLSSRRLAMFGIAPLPVRRTLVRVTHRLGIRPQVEPHAWAAELRDRTQSEERQLSPPQ